VLELSVFVFALDFGPIRCLVATKLQPLAEYNYYNALTGHLLHGENDS